MLCASSPLTLEQLIKDLGAEANKSCHCSAVALPKANAASKTENASMSKDERDCFTVVAELTGPKQFHSFRSARVEEQRKLAASRVMLQMSQMKELESDELPTDASCALIAEKLERCKEQIAFHANEVSALRQFEACAKGKCHTPLTTQKDAASEQEAELRAAREQLVRQEEVLASNRGVLEACLRRNQELKLKIKADRKRVEASDAMLGRVTDRIQEAKHDVLVMLHAQLAYYQKGHFMKVDPSTLSIDSVLCNGYAARMIMNFYRMLLDSSVESVSDRDVFADLAAAFPAQVQLTDHTIHVAPL